jgi:hypothetical protein
VTQEGRIITQRLIFLLMFRSGSVLEGLERLYDFVGEGFAEDYSAVGRGQFTL